MTQGSRGRAAPQAGDAQAKALDGESIRLFNVKYSPNLGDGLLSEALENGLRDLGADEAQTFSVDLAARTTYRRGGVSRSLLLKALNVTPTAFRQQAIRLPLEIMLRRRWRPHYEAQLGAAQAVVIGGGNLFSDMDLNFPSKIAATLHLAARRNLPTAIYGVGAAGRWSTAGISIMSRALLAARPCYVSVRDAASKAHFDSMFAQASGREAEIVRDPGLLVSRYVAAPVTSAEARPIGLCVTSAIAVSYHSSLATTVSELSEWYVALCGRLKGEGRTVIGFTNGSPEDEQFLDAIASSLEQAGGGNFKRRTVANPTELAELIAGLGVLVAHRMHALIAGYSYGVPIFALQWDAKVDAFMESVGAGEWLAKAAAENLDKVASAVHELLAPDPQITTPHRLATLDDAFADIRELAACLREAVASRRNGSPA